MIPTDWGSSLQLSPISSPGPREQRQSLGARICIVSHEINGPSRNGGIGTAYTTLAEKLTSTGHEVTLLYLLGSLTERQPIEAWVESFRQRGMRLVPLEPSEVPLSGSRSLQLSYLVYRWLKEQESQGNRFDVIHFHEWLGFGYYTLLARHQGLAFRDATICVGLHSPSLWIQEANQALLDDPDLLECDALERRCAELANVVWSPSQYLLDWVRDQGWDIGDRAWVHPNPVPTDLELSPSDRPPAAIRELVFFGRLEVRKGVILFCDALDRLEAGDLSPTFGVTFLGKSCLINEVDAATYIRERSVRWSFPVNILTGCDHAGGLAYIRQPGCLVVMPSLLENCPLTVIECLSLGVPFLASAVGGIPELVAEDSWADVLFAPDADTLAWRLKQALRQGIHPARPAVDSGSCDRTWDQWHRQGNLSGEPAALAPLWSAESRLAHPAGHRGARAAGSPGGSAHPAADAACSPESMAEAHGEFVLILGRGVTLLPGAVRQLARVARTTGADIVTGLEDVYGETPTPLYRRLWPGIDSMLGLVRNCFGGACLFVRRESLDRMRVFVEEAPPSARNWEFLTRAILHGLHLEVIPEPLFTTCVEEESKVLDLAACLRPCVEEVPAQYRDLLRLVQGQSVRVQRLEEQLARECFHKALRYRIADAVYLCLARIPLARPVLRWFVRTVFRV